MARANTVQMNVYINDQLKAAIDKVAEEECSTASAVMRRALFRDLKKHVEIEAA
jgi:predicted transcriptional regulator